MTDASTPDPQLARARLLAEKSRLEDLVAELADDRSNAGGISLSADGARETTAASVNFGLRDSFLAQLREIDAALQRVHDGTYGFDETTGDPIDPARLEADPTARTNVPHPD